MVTISIYIYWKRRIR